MFLMLFLMYKLIRPLLFSLDPETAHNLVSTIGKAADDFFLSRHLLRMLYRSDPGDSEQIKLYSKIGDLTFPNPVGAAAGFDKKGILTGLMYDCGFGFSETGTFTRYCQVGNPRPRLFRLPKDKALINRMGFNNIGADEAAEHFASSKKPDFPVGINIGKSKKTETIQNKSNNKKKRRLNN